MTLWLHAHVTAGLEADRSTAFMKLPNFRQHEGRRVLIHLHVLLVATLNCIEHLNLIGSLLLHSDHEPVSLFWRQMVFEVLLGDDVRDLIHQLLHRVIMAARRLECAFRATHII